MGLLGTPQAADVAINAAGRPYDPSTGKLLPAAAAEEPVHAEQPTVTTRAKHSNDLYDAAAFFGISPHEADTIETPMLRKMLRTMTTEQERARDAAERARFWEQQLQGKQVIHPERQIQQPAEEQFDLGDELDPAVAPKTHSILKKMWEENQRLRKQVDEVGTTVKRQAVTEHTQKVDRAFARLAASDEYGESDFGDLEPSPNSPQFIARMKVYAEAGLKGGESQAQIDKAIKKAHLYLQADKPAKAVGYEVANQEPTPAPKKAAAKGVIDPEEWKRGGVGAPTRRAAEELPQGREKAIAAVAGILGKGTPQFEEDKEIKAGLFRRNGVPATP